MKKQLIACVIAAIFNLSIQTAYVDSNTEPVPMTPRTHDRVRSFLYKELLGAQACPDNEAINARLQQNTLSFIRENRSVSIIHTEYIGFLTLQQQDGTTQEKWTEVPVEIVRPKD